MNTYRHIDGPHEGEVISTQYNPMTLKREETARGNGGVSRLCVERLIGDAESFYDCERVQYWTHLLNGEPVLSISRDALRG
jgi:hypothetical protein